MSTTALSAPLAPVSELLVGLSHERAAAGDDRGAGLAAWAADVHVLEALLWQHGLGETPDPAAQLAALGEVVAGTLTSIAAELRTAAAGDRDGGAGSDGGAGWTARAVVERAREAMLSTFDESVHELLVERFAPLDHLDAIVHTGADTGADAAADAGATTDRLGGRTPAELVAELRAAAADCMAVASLLAAEHHETAAVRQARQSDAAAFEAYLVDAAARAGDTGLAGVELRWTLADRMVRELAESVAATGPEQPADHSADHPADHCTEPAADHTSDHMVDDVLLEQRRRLTGLVGWAERDALAAALEPLPEPVVLDHLAATGLLP